MLFRKFATDTDIPFGYAPDGCIQRATLMALSAEKEHVRVGLIYAEGSLIASTKLYPNQAWAWHVAPVTYVKQADGSTALMVFDPALSSAPLTVEQWKRTMSVVVPGQKPPTISQIYFGSRYQGPTRDVDPTITKWRPEQVADAKNELAQYELYVPSPNHKGSARSLNKWIPAAGLNEEGEGSKE